MGCSPDLLVGHEILRETLFFTGANHEKPG